MADYDVNELEKRISGLRIAVIGDFALDRNNINAPSGKASLEFEDMPIRITKNQGKEYTPGGAGTVTCNLRTLGVGYVAAFGVIGDDEASRTLVRSLNSRGIDASNLVKQDDRISHMWEKFYTHSQRDLVQTYRLDTENTKPVSDQSQKSLLRMVAEKVGDFDGFFISDQFFSNQYSCIGRELESGLKQVLNGRTVVCDSRENIKNYFDSGFILKPNLQELLGPRGDVSEVSRVVMENKIPYMYVTLHEKGCLYASDRMSSPVLIPSINFPNGDPTGCGDSFGAAVLTAICLGIDPLDAGRFANASAYHTVQQIGGCGMPNLQGLLNNYGLLYPNNS